MNQKTISKLFTESKGLGTYRWESNVENAIEETVKILVKNLKFSMENLIHFSH